MCQICNHLPNLSFEESVNQLCESHSTLTEEHVVSVARDILLQESVRVQFSQMKITKTWEEAFDKLEDLRKIYQKDKFVPLADLLENKTRLLN